MMEKVSWNLLVSSGRFDGEKNFWRKALSGDFVTGKIPHDLQIPSNSSYEEQFVSIKLPQDMLNILNNMSQNSEHIKYIILLSGIIHLMTKYSCKNDILLGIPDFKKDLCKKNIILPLRTTIDKQSTFKQMLLELKQSVSNVNKNSNLPYPMIMDLLGIEEYSDENSPFNTIVLSDNIHNKEFLEQVHSDTVFTIVSRPEYLEIKLKYNACLFNKNSMEAVLVHLINLYGITFANPDIRLVDIDILSENEKNHILFDFNNTSKTYPKEKTMQQLFEEQVQKTPQNIAVAYLNEKITYEQLNKRANMLACTLRSKGIKPNDIVGIAAERSVEMIIGIYAVLKSGGAYLPISPAYPNDRIEYMAKDSQIKIMLTQSRFIDKINLDCEVIDIESPSSYAETDKNPENVNSSADTAYVIYTSGSTGSPKGAMIAHYSAVNRIIWMQRKYPLLDADVILQKTPYTFDVSVWEIFWWGMTGASVCMLPQGDEKNPKALIETIGNYGITTMHFVPSMLNSFLKYVDAEKSSAENLNSLTKVFASGEALEIKHVNKFNRLLNTANQALLINLYGPTEAAIDVSYFDCSATKEPLESVPIGKPIDNINLYILDQYDNLQPVGLSGEICISGDGVGKGYVNNEELTSEKFVPDPFVAGRKMYRTGDNGKWLPDGNIEYLGRNDSQVKIRGFRIEPGEIEHCLLSNPMIKDAVVTVGKDPDGNNFLKAFFVSDKSEEDLNLKNYLLEKLPKYMVPQYFKRIDQIPLTENGKVDKKELNLLEYRLSPKVEYIAPQTEIEKKLVEIWQEILNMEKIGLLDNFFDLGGHSLKATNLILNIRKQLGFDIPLGEIFKAPTIQGILQYISGIEISECPELRTVTATVENGKERYPASAAQKRLLILSKFNTLNTTYNLPITLEIDGKIDIIMLGQAFKTLVNRHQSFRTSFEFDGSTPVQIIHNDVEFAVECIDSNVDDVDALVNSLVRPFELSKAPLLRTNLINVGSGKYVLFMDMHHIISDAVSLNILSDELIRLYRGEKLPFLKIQYKDFSIWQNEVIQKKLLQHQENYWLEEFKGEIPVLNLPTDYKRPDITSFEGEHIPFRLEKHLLDKLNKLSVDSGCTLYMILLSAYNILLSKYTDQEDIIIGSPVAGRTHPEIQGIIGMFINILAMRNYPVGKKSITEFLEDVKLQSIKAFENQDYQFEELVEKLDINRDISRHPLFATMFVLQNTNNVELKADDLTFRTSTASNNVSKFEITLTAVEDDNGIDFEFEYCTKLFKIETIQRMAKHFTNIINCIIENPDARLFEIDILSREERNMLLFEFNDTHKEYPENRRLHQLFEEQVQKTPENIALIFNGQEISYSELNKKANRLAWKIKDRTAENGKIVAILMDNSIEMIVSILGVLKSGNAYLPIDISCPLERIKYMLDDSNTSILLLKSDYADGSEFECEKIFVDSVDSSDSDNLDNLELPIDNESTAYVIYTSGTTGKPKGVMVSHQSIFDRIMWRKEKYALDSTDTVLQLFSFSFDGFLTSFFTPIVSGASVVILENEQSKDPIIIKNNIVKHNITHFISIPGLFDAILESSNNPDELKSLNIITLAGDTIPTKLIEKCKEKAPNLKIINEYGPTEGTVLSSASGIIESGNAITIGKPISNTRIYIVDRYNNLKPFGLPGELCISGKGLSKGYLNNPELTNEKFIESPFLKSETIYKTGDLACYSNDGNIKFLGRLDNQVKIRGYRIELGEIESQILKHLNVKETIVCAVTDQSGNDSLCAYITSIQQPDIQEIRNLLSKELPQYMIPTHFVHLDELPRTSTGKIDKKRLPLASFEQETEYIEPTNETEKQLKTLWEEVLEIENIGINHNFFKLGGHSLKAAVLTIKINKLFDIEILLVDVFKNPTIRQLATYVQKIENRQSHAIVPIEPKEYYDTSEAQKRIYMQNLLDKTGTALNIPSYFIINEEIDKTRINQIFNDIVSRHEILRTQFDVVNGNIVQKVLDDINFEPKYLEQGDLSDKKFLTDMVKPFNISKAPLLRSTIVKLEQKKYVIFIDIHHILCDGISIEILSEEFVRLYRGEQIEKPSLQYKDYVVWQQNMMNSDKNHKMEEYWVNKFKGELPMLNLQSDYVRPDVKKIEGSHVSIKIDSVLSEKLHRIASQTDTTLYMLLLASYNALLYKYTGQEDIIVGTLSSGRNHPEIEKMIGVFLNTLVARNYPEGQKTFTEFLEDVKSNTIEMFENQEYPFGKWVEKLGIKTDRNRGTAVFDVGFFFQNENEPLDRLNTDGFEFSTVDFDSGTAITFLMLHVIERKNSIDIKIDYRNDILKESTVKRFGEHFINLLTQITDNTQVKLGNIDILSKHERNQIIFDFNKTTESYRLDKPAYRLFEERVARTPDAKALIYEKIKADKHDILDTSISYRQLNEKANKIANFLISKGLKSRDIVGVMLPQSPDFIISMLGIMKAGGVYMPIDPHYYPQDRLMKIVANSKLRFLISKEETIDNFSFSQIQGFTDANDQVLFTGKRPQIQDFDSIPFPDVTLIDYEKYSKFSGIEAVDNAIVIQASRGCPYKCAYCHNIWPKTHVKRSAENIFEEIKIYYDLGIRKFSFVDDIFNLDVKNSSRFYNLILKNKMKLQMHFPNGLRGDILTNDYMDLMAEAGVCYVSLALETASPRLQKLIHKNMNLERLKENIDYLASKHPQILIQLFSMHGFPTETEEEAMMTMDFMRNSKWLDFPYVNILKIYPNTQMEKIALANGVRKEDILSSDSQAYYELPQTLPFSKSFTKEYRSILLNEYFMLKERLIAKLPYQIKVMTETEIARVYGEYFMAESEIKTIPDLLAFIGISPDELPSLKCVNPEYGTVLNFNNRAKKYFPKKAHASKPLKILLLDITQSLEKNNDRIFERINTPVGLMYLMTYLNEKFGSKIDGKIAKPLIDFKTYDELKNMIDDYKPDVIGIRSMNYYKETFHKITSLIKYWGVKAPIISGGPYASSCYEMLLNDHNIDIAIVGEGELTLAHIVEKILSNGNKLPNDNVLETIPGIAFLKKEFKEENADKKCEVLMLDLAKEAIEAQPSENLQLQIKPKDPAYVIYTSGTTGVPKGVLIKHESLTNLVMSQKNMFEVNPNSRLLQFASYSFDVSIWEVFHTLAGGASIYLADKTKTNIENINDTLREKKINTVYLPPSVLKVISNKNIPELNTLVAAGEELSKELAKKWSDSVDQFINAYGPTEATVYASINPNVRPDDVISIGKPVSNFSAYILDCDMNPVPIGVAGELYFGGIGIASGYLNMPELTKEKFVDNPFRGNEKIYKTGDVAKWTPGGNIVFLGRLDHQVKLRGFRIELGEIESELLNHSAVKNASVVDFTNADGSKYLCAYLVSNEEIEINVIRAHLKRTLPDYMIPSYFVQLDSFPLTGSGKLNRKALPNPTSQVSTDEEFKAPENRIQEILIDAFEEILGVKNVGISDNFFLLGGDSIKALRVSAQLQKYGITLKVSDLLNNPIIENASHYVKIKHKNYNPDSSQDDSSINSVLEDEYKFIVEQVGSDIQSIYGLSPMQEDMLFLSLAYENSDIYFKQIVLNIEGDLNIQLLEKSFNTIIQKYDVLRTNFVYEHLLKPVQVVLKKRTAHILFTDLSGKGDETSSLTEKFIQNDFSEKFDLSKDMLMRISVAKTDSRKHTLVWSFHHMLIDGWSTSILLKDIMGFYNAFLENKPVAIKETPPYINYIKWLDEQNVEESYEYWSKYLEAYEKTAMVPRNTLSGESEGKHMKVSFELDKTLSNSIFETAAKNNVTLNTMIKTIWGILLQRYTDTDDVVFGTVVSNRSPEIENSQEMVGLFINTIPIRIKCNKNLPFSELIKNIQKEALESQKHEYLQLTEIQSKSHLKNMLVEHLLIFENYPISKEIGGEDNFDNLNIEVVEILERTDYDFGIGIIPGETLTIAVGYNTKIYSTAIMYNIKHHLIEVIQQVVSNPDILTGDINILTDNERLQLSNTFNSNVNPYPKDKTIHELFEEQTFKTPDNIAVSFENTHLTYGQLNEKANRIASLIRSKCTNCNVALLSEHSNEMIAAVIGILKSGCTYLPIDPKHPKQRVDYMLSDSKTSLVLTHSKLAHLVPENTDVICIDKLETYTDAESTTINIPKSPESGAYMIYTSGSTGKPKGVVVSHRALNNFIHSFYNKFEGKVDHNDNCLSLTNICFDVSIAEIFLPLTFGATLVLFGTSTILDAQDIANTIMQKSITFAYIPPTILMDVFEVLSESDEKLAFNKMLVGVEPIKDIVLENYMQLNDNMQIINGYGPTEATICTTMYKYVPHKAVGKNVPIGVPMHNNKVYLLDKDERLVPIGIPGELCVSGDNLSNGYFQNEFLNQEKFVQDPFDSSKKMYKTGDLAYYLEDGNIMFVGRIDNQVKIRGYRIELGEIENIILKQPYVKEVFVTDLINSLGIKYLCAYIVSNMTISTEKLRNSIKTGLPEYMVPTHFIQIPKLPATINGKIDKKSLPLPEQKITTDNHVAPRNENEKLLVSIWENILGIKNIGIFDKFFNIGGDSIKSTRMVSQLRKHGLSLKVTDILHYPDIASLSTQIKKVQTKINRDMVKGDVTLTPIQCGFFEQDFHNKDSFNQNFMLYKKEGFNPDILIKVFTELLKHHDALRMIYNFTPNGVIQFNRGLSDEMFTLEVVNVDPAQNLSQIAMEKTVSIQNSMNIKTGSIVKLCLFKTNDGDHLLIMIHHLVVDIVSWGILAEDLAIAYKSVIQGQKVKLANKTDSFQEWSKKLSDYANSPKLLKEIDYWAKIEQTENITLPKDFDNSSSKKSFETVGFELSEEYTDRLLTQSNNAYDTETNELILTAVGCAFKDWTKHDFVTIKQEGYGREAIDENVDITRTVGWFTSIYPVILDMSVSKGIANQIKCVKQTLRNIPNKGIGYGILEYLTDAENKKQLSFNLKPEIAYNYLGLFGNDTLNTDVFEVSKLDYTDNAAQTLDWKENFIINAAISDKKLNMNITYNKSAYSEATINNFINSFEKHMKEIINFCVDNASLSDVETEQICNQILVDVKQMQDKFADNVLNGAIVDTYPLSPSQELMIANDNFSGTIIKLDFAIDVNTFNRAVLEIIKTQSLLRSITRKDNDKTVWVELEAPTNLNVPYIDISNYNSTLKEVIKRELCKIYNQSYKNQEGLLYRLLLIKEDVSNYTLLLPFDHCIFDMVSGDILRKDIVEYYKHCESNSNFIAANPSSHYKDYVKQMLLGPINVSESIIIKQFELEKFANASNIIGRILGNSKGKTTPYSFEFDTDACKIDFSDIEQQIVQISTQFLNTVCLKYFGIPNIPAVVVNRGRRYLNNNYFDIIGDFSDDIPVLIDIANPDSVLDTIQYRVNFASKHNINFALLSARLDDGYSKITEYLSTNPLNPSIVFNFQGAVDIAEIREVTSLRINNENMSSEPENNIYFTIRYSDSTVQCLLSLPFDADTKELEDIKNTCIADRIR